MSDFFNNMKNIQYEDFHQFLSAINAGRFKSEEVNKDCIKIQVEKIQIDKMEYLPEGAFSVEFPNVTFDCFYREKEKASKLYVFLNGGAGANAIQPVFARWSYFPYLDGSMLNIADPMYKLSDEITVGWYYGNEHEFYLNNVLKIVENVAKLKHISSNDIIFWGSSAGGYSALYCACKIKNSNAIAINPQFKTSFLVESWEKLNKVIKINENDIYHREDISDLIRINKTSRLILVENCRSKEDMNQMEHLCKILNVRMKYGLQKLYDNIICWVYDADYFPYHNSQETKSLLYAINNLLNIDIDNIQNYENLYLNYGELWHDEFVKKKALYMEKNRIDLIFSNYDNFVNFHRIECLNKKEIKIPKSSSIWNHITLFTEFSPKKIYYLKIENSKCLTQNTEFYEIAIKNINYKILILKKRCKVNSTVNIIFRTNELIANLELRIYSGIIGKAKDISLQFENIKLCELVCSGGKYIEL